MFCNAPNKAALRFVAMFLLLSSMLVAAESEPVSCRDESPGNGKVYSVKGKHVNLRSGPGRSYERIRDESDKIAKLEDGYIVRENCREGDWSQIDLLSPDWLRKSHRGWVYSRFLAR